MPTPIPKERLPGLRAALKQFQPGEDAAQQQLAEIYGVTNARMTTLIKTRFENFPPAKRHEDKTHWYEAIPALQAMIAYIEGHGAKKRAAGARHRAILTGGVQPAKQQAQDEADAEPLGPGDLLRLAQTQNQVFKLKKEQGKLLDADQQAKMVREVVIFLTRELGGLAHALDPHGRLPVELRAQLHAKAREIVNGLNERLGKLIDDVEGRSGSPSGSGTGHSGHSGRTGASRRRGALAA